MARTKKQEDGQVMRRHQKHNLRVSSERAAEIIDASDDKRQGRQRPWDKASALGVDVKDTRMETKGQNQTKAGETSKKKRRRKEKPRKERKKTEMQDRDPSGLLIAGLLA